MLKFRHLLIFCLYFIITLVIVGHPPTALINNFIGSDTGDVYEMARNIWWFKYAIQHGEPLFYQTWLGYPDGINGIIFISVPLQYFPMWALAFVMPIAVAYNFTVLFWMALNGWAMMFLVRYLLNRDDSWIPSFMAGLVYMAFPLFQGHLAEGHAGLMVAWAVPLYIWALFRYTSTDSFSWRWLLISILFFYLSTTGHILQSIYVLIPVTGTFLLGKLWLRDWQAVRRILGMGLLASIVLLGALAPAILDATGETSYASTGGYSRYSADLLAIVSPSFFNPLFDTVLPYTRTVLGTNLGEGMAYIGIVAGTLAMIGLVTNKASRWWFLLGSIAWLFSLGPVLKILNEPVLIAGNPIPLPFALLQNLPGFSLARTPARFNFALAIALAVMVAYGMSWIWQQRTDKWRYGLALVLSFTILVEYQSFWAQPLRTATVPQEIINLRNDESIDAIFNIPYQHALSAKDALFLQTGHEQPLIAGQITRTTPVNPAMLAMLQGTLDPILLNQVHADIVILHRARASEIGELEILESRANEQLGAPIYQDEQIAIYRVPQSDTDNGLVYDFERPNIDLSGGMTLIGSDIYDWDNQTYIWLQWQFNRARPDTDVRFMHLVDENGEIIFQDDSSLGVIVDGEIRTELIVFDTSTLAETNYIIRTGWYDFNTLTNYLTPDNQGAIIIREFQP
ncbi:MAG: hypothetical protein Phog2KO_06860 [Phototrophicaceae bacterium]